MTLDPFLRRHGHGVAHLAIGATQDGLSLGRLAARPVSHEALVARLPGLVSVLAALLLGWSLSRIESVAPDRAPTVEPADADSALAIRIWQESRPTGVPTSPSPPVRSRASIPSRAVSAAVPPAPDRPPSPKKSATPAPTPSSPRRAPFDPRSLALQPARATTLPSLSDPLPPARPTSSDASERPRAGAARAPVRLRRALLASVPSPERLPSPVDPVDPASPPEASAPTPRPPVSAPAHEPGLADSIRSELERWDEVPLDDLPDCTPSGRQDALKQQILRAVPFNRECSHPEGRYRFVQTRNLNAFLMWSRPNPDAPLRRDGDRDACDVLERALRCLGNTSNEEHSIR